MSAQSSYCARHDFEFKGFDCPWCASESPQASQPRTVQEVATDRASRLGRNVERLMDQRHMSFMDMAKAAGVSKTCIAKIIEGRTDARASTLFAIADFFGVTIDALFTGCVGNARTVSDNGRPTLTASECDDLRARVEDGESVADEYEWLALLDTVASLRKQRDMMLRAADELLTEKNVLRDEAAVLREIVHEVSVSGVESDLSPRYLVVQIGCETWADVQRAASAGTAPTTGGTE